MIACDLQPGQRVRIIQTIDRRDRDWLTAVAGVVQAVEPQKTGSWLAHGKDDKLWLLRIRLVKDDGEVTVLTIDPRTRIEPLPRYPEAPLLPNDAVLSGRAKLQLCPLDGTPGRS